MAKDGLELDVPFRDAAEADAPVSAS
jgi:hypothetical protein